MKTRIIQKQDGMFYPQQKFLFWWLDYTGEVRQIRIKNGYPLPDEVEEVTFKFESKQEAVKFLESAHG